MASVDRVQRRCTRHCGLRRAQLSCAGLQGENSTPSPADETSYKADAYKAAPPACALAGRAWTLQGELVTAFFNQRIKISFSSEPNSSSFRWCEHHLAGGRLLRADWKGSVTICVYLDVCNFITYIGLHIYHHSQTAI